MGEMITRVQEAVATAAEYAQNRMALGGVLFVGALGVAGCGSSTQVRTVTAAREASATTLNQANTDCGEALNLSANRADTTYGSPDSLFPTLDTQHAGQEKLFPVDQAKASIKEQLANDERALGVFTAFFMETRTNEQLPDAATMSRAQQLIETYTNNKELAAQDADKACQAVDFLVPTTTFAVTKGQAVEIVTKRDAHGRVVSIETQMVNATENLSGFELGFNDDNASLSPAQKAIYAKLSGLMLITADGKIVINQLIGPGSFRVAQNTNKTPATVVKGGQPVGVKPTKGSGPAQGGSAQQRNGGGSSGSSQNGSGPGTPTGPGKKPESQPGTSTGHSHGKNPTSGGKKHEAAPNGTDQTPSGGGSNGGGTGTTPTGGNTPPGTPPNTPPATPPGTPPNTPPGTPPNTPPTTPPGTPPTPPTKGPEPTCVPSAYTPCT